MTQHPFHTTAWGMHRRFAPRARSLWGEARLLGKTNKRTGDDDQATVPGGRAIESDASGNDQRTPEKRWAGIQKENAHRRVDADDLIETMQQMNLTELSEFFEEDPDAIKLAVLERNRSGAKQVIKVLDEKLIKDPVRFREHIIELIRTNKAPKDDEKLQAIMKETREQAKETEDSGEPTFWNRLLNRMAQDFRREFGPLYPPLARVLLTSSVQKSFGRSPDRVFASLDEPSNRLPLMRSLAGLRYVLLEDADLDEVTRTKRLDDLLTCMEQTEEFLTAEERRECAHLIAMVGAVRAHAHALSEAPHTKEDGEKERADHSEYQTKIQNLRSLFRNEKGQPRKIRGKDGLRAKLEREGRNDQAVAIIAKGLEDGEWIDRLHHSEEFKYSCALIALEELGILYNRIIHGHYVMHPQSLMENVKRLIANAFRLGLRGYKRKDDSPFTEEEIDPRKDFENLRARMDQKQNAGESLSQTEIDELALLGAIYGEYEGREIMSREELDAYRAQGEPTRAELDAKAEEERRLLVSAVEGSSVLRADVLQKADLPTLRSAQSELREEQMLEERQEELRRRKRNQSGDENGKDALRLNSEPSDAFRKACDHEFAQRRMAILGSNEADEEKQKRIEKLEREYEEEKKLRHRLHKANIRGGWGKLLTSLIETEVRRGAAQLQEQYLSEIAPHLQKRAQILQKKHGSVIEAPDYELIEPQEADSFDTLRNLRSVRIDPASRTCYEDTGTILHDLHHMEKELADSPEKQASERQASRKIAQKNASSIIEHAENNLPEDTRSALEAHANDESRPSHIAQKGLAEWNAHRAIYNKAAKAVQNESPTPPSLTNLEQKAMKIADELNSMIGTFAGNDVAFERAVRAKIQGEVLVIVRGVNASKKNFPLSKQELTNAERACRRLEAIADSLRNSNREPITLPYESFQKFAAKNGLPSYTWGAYDRVSKRIILNADKVGYYGAREAVLTEERRHALHDALGEAYPLYLEDAFDAFVSRMGDTNVQEEFLALAETWKSRNGLQESEWKSEVMDEFLAKKTVFRMHAAELKNGEPVPQGIPLSEREVRFFRKIAPLENGLALDFRESNQASLLTLGATAASRDDEGATAVAEPLVEDSRAPQELEKIRQMFIKIDGFIDAEKAYRTSDNEVYVKELKDEYERVLEKWRKKSAESKDATRNRITSLHNEVEGIVKKINEHDKNARDLSNEPEKFDLWFTIWNDINWVTISDIIAIVSAIKEDITRQYQRRQQARIGRVGESVTSWIQNVPILKDLPYINALSSEFKRRESQSESEEVNKYKEAYGERDSYELQEMLHSPSSKDQMKAVLHLLSERGRIDWNDVEFWKALNHLSRFEMPIKECQRNENLKEDWLRKQMQDIFGDKDQYRSWKSANDSKIASGKKDFTTECDRLSNLKGGLSGELQKQLYMFVQAKKKGESIPDDVQPHLYEEILDYSIRNGKMSMEDKFFYLVQGIDSGIISRDRLGYLAGEGSGILNIFGFIDYFYGRNNSRPEIESLARRLRESNDEDHPDYYKPGIKTTLWLELEVAREESVIQRVSKGMSKRGGETDHDDMHFFIPRIDADTVASLTTPQGGGRPQLTPQAWENAYSGFNSFFKSFGILAKLEADGLDKFSSGDAREIIRAAATFVRMDSILTRRDTFGDNEGRRAALNPSTMRSRKSVVNDNGDNVYTERGKVTAFIKALIRAYNLPPEFIEVMLYDTEREGAYNPNKKDRAKNLSYEFQSKLNEAIRRDGVTKLKAVLKEFEPKLNTHETGYNYESISAIRKKETN